MPLTREGAFELWAPDAAPWSPWAKPVLFAHLPKVLEPDDDSLQLTVTAPWPRATGEELLVVDLPGAWSLELAESFVHAGFRPVPLFNAIPARLDELMVSGRYQPRELVDVDPIVEALGSATLRLQEALSSLRLEAPPAFLLDSQRSFGGPPRPGDFDNRSISLPTDFPSAELLKARGITRVLLVLAEDSGEDSADEPSSDLAHTLLRWQQAGLVISSCRVDAAGHCSPRTVVQVRRPRWFRALWYGVLATFGLRRSPLGGFGGKLPLPSSG